MGGTDVDEIAHYVSSEKNHQSRDVIRSTADSIPTAPVEVTRGPTPFVEDGRESY
jgi:hypothetical protein